MSFQDEQDELPLSEQLMNGIVRTKRELFPLLEKSQGLNESAIRANVALKQAWTMLEEAYTIIKNRGNKGNPR